MTATMSTESEGHAGDPEPAPVVLVSKAVAAPLTHVWEVLVSDSGAAALLGEGARLGAKGEPYHTLDGVCGVLRSYHPLEQLRVSWHENSDSPASIVEVDLRVDGEGTVLDLRQDHLPAMSDVDTLSGRWRAALDAVAERAEA
jgi:hypothetical protein